MFGLDPPPARLIARRLALEDGQGPPPEDEVVLVSGQTVKIQEKIRYPRQAAADPVIVPEAGGLLFGNPAVHKPVGLLLDEPHPGRVPGQAEELIEEIRRPDRPVAPAEIEEVFAIGLVVKDQAGIVV